VSKDRYEVKLGKWGCYFYDRKSKEDLTLIDVLLLLEKSNNKNKLEKEGD